MGDYKQELSLNMSARLAVSIKMALYQFLLKPLNQNIFLVFFMSVFFTIRFLYLKKKNKTKPGLILREKK